MRTPANEPDMNQKARPDMRGRDEREERQEREQMRDAREVEMRERAQRPGMSADREIDWQDIKGRFVDDPAGALAAAEQAVLGVVERKIRALKDEAASLCAPGRGEEESETEAQRTRLIRYQAYYDRLANGR